MILRKHHAAKRASPKPNTSTDQLPDHESSDGMVACFRDFRCRVGLVANQQRYAMELIDRHRPVDPA